MTHDPADEPPIDTSLTHYMEQQALAIALDKANTPNQRAKVEHLIALRLVLMQHREAFHQEAVAKRHARGEIYSKARVAAINAMGPTRSDLDSHVKSSYLRQPDAEGVLKAHARSHFAYGLMSARLMLALCTPDIADAARAMQRHEDAFAREWVDAIADAGFKPELQQAQREALRVLRTSTRAMYFVTHPDVLQLDDLGAGTLGKAWNKLDELAQDLGMEPLSSFIALPGEEDSAGVPAQRMLPTLAALIDGVQSPGQKFPSKRAVVTVLTDMRDALLRLSEQDGRAYFEVDI
jgi:hypothetical protein